MVAIFEGRCGFGRVGAGRGIVRKRRSPNSDRLKFVSYLCHTCVIRIQIDPFSHQFFIYPKHKKTPKILDFRGLLLFFDIRLNYLFDNSERLFYGIF